MTPADFDLLTVKRLAVETNTICIATIHQPNYETFSLFDKLLLLAGGRVMYNGPCSAFVLRRSRNAVLTLLFADKLDSYLEELSLPTPQHSNPSDHAIQVVNTEFYDTAGSELTAMEHLDYLAKVWREHSAATITPHEQLSEDHFHSGPKESAFASSLHKTGILIERNFQNYRRNVLAFGIRSASFLALDSGLGLTRYISSQWECTSAWHCFSLPSGSTSAPPLSRSTTV